MIRLTYIALFALLFMACNRDKDEIEGRLYVDFVYDGSPFDLDTYYSTDQGQEVLFTTLKFYIADLVFYTSEDKDYYAIPYELFDLDEFAPNGKRVSTSISLPEGSYERMTLGVGLPVGTNQSDPAQYESTHPLSMTNNMYWSWSSFYIFSKGEGFVVSNSDTTAWFIHAGLDELYRPGVEVKQSIDWTGENPEIRLTMDVAKLIRSQHALDLYNDGQSHSFDNMPLATKWCDNFSKAFN